MGATFTCARLDVHGREVHCHRPSNLQELDPYYPFEEAVDVWARTFAALGINYKVRGVWRPMC